MAEAELGSMLMALTALAIIGAWFVVLERTGKREVILGLLLGVVLLDALGYPNQGSTPRSLLYPAFAGEEIRPPQALIPMALGARFLVHGLPRRFTTTGLAWAAFFTWYGLGVVAGMENGVPQQSVLFHAKAVVYVAGGMAFAAGLNPTRLVERRRLGRWVGALAIVVIPTAVINYAKAGTNVSLPGLPNLRLGSYAADASSTVVTIAIVALVVEVCRRDRRLWVASACLALILTPFAGTQTAAVLNLSAAAIGVVALAVTTAWRRRIGFRPAQTVLFVVAVAAVAALLVAVPVYRNSALPLADNIERSFLNEAEGGSAEGRRELWAKSRVLILERPLVGWGLGMEIDIRRVQPNYLPGPPLRATAHNLAADILLRRGLIGLALFLAAVLFTARDALWAWRRHPHPLLAGLAAGCAVATAGLLAKGMVESVFEKFRLATMLGLLLGVIAAVWRHGQAAVAALDAPGVHHVRDVVADPSTNLVPKPRVGSEVGSQSNV